MNPMKNQKELVCSFVRTAASLLLCASGIAVGQAGAPHVLITGGATNGSGFGPLPLLASSEVYQQQSGIFVASANMTVARDGHDATLLQNGQVLITGGDVKSGSSSAPTASAEVYDPCAQTFTATGSMTDARVGHTATLLPNGKVLVAGGQNSRFVTQATADLYDPTTGLFTPTGNMTTPRVEHIAVLLANGKVLIAGGENNGGILASAELYDPATGVFTAGGTMTATRSGPTATLLENGTVLITGGGSNSCGGCSQTSAETFNPGSGTFVAVGPMGYSRRAQTATLLINGAVLVTGGIDDALGAEILNTAEIYNPSTRAFTPTANMTTPREAHDATLLHDGNVLVTGGLVTGTEITATAELFDVTNATFVATGSMTAARLYHTSTALPAICSE
jgi:hypothetical protein